jgi:hypothetical protein
MARRYAEGTSVSVAQSRGEIDKLLRDWGCDQIIWADDHKEGRAMLRFLWENEGVQYIARFPLNIPTNEELEELAVHGTTGAFLPSRFEKLCDRRGRTPPASPLAEGGLQRRRGRDH